MALLDSLVPEYGGSTVYVPKKPSIDWELEYKKWRAKEITQGELAGKYQVSRRTVIRKFKALGEGK